MGDSDRRPGPDDPANITRRQLCTLIKRIHRLELLNHAELLGRADDRDGADERRVGEAAMKQIDWLLPTLVCVSMLWLIANV